MTATLDREAKVKPMGVFDDSAKNYDRDQGNLSFADVPSERDEELPWPDALPAPGLYPDVSYETYAKWPAMNATTLLWGLTSMEHMKVAMDGLLSKESPALDFGKAYHMRLLEPALFAEKYLVQTGCEALLKSGEREGQKCGNEAKGVAPDGRWLCGAHSKGIETNEPEFCISRYDSRVIEAMAAKVKSHPVVKLLRQHGGYECSGTARVDGIPFKFRLDKGINLDGKGSCPPTIVDLKKCRPGKAATDEFSREILNYHYHIRAAIYVDAVAYLIGSPPAFVWCAQEDAIPYGVNVLRATKTTIDIGRYERQSLTDMYKFCLRSGEWPGYATDFQNANLPDWYLKRFGE